jgi:hypothetical protein
MKTLPRVATEMALHVLPYDLMRVANILEPKRKAGWASPIATHDR